MEYGPINFAGQYLTLVWHVATGCIIKLKVVLFSSLLHELPKTILGMFVFVWMHIIPYNLYYLNNRQFLDLSNLSLNFVRSSAHPWHTSIALKLLKNDTIMKCSFHFILFTISLLSLCQPNLKSFGYYCLLYASISTYCTAGVSRRQAKNVF